MGGIGPDLRQASWRRSQKIEVTRSRAYKKNDQAFVEQKNGAVVRRLMGCGRFDDIEPIDTVSCTGLVRRGRLRSTRRASGFLFHVAVAHAICGILEPHSFDRPRKSGPLWISL